MKIVEVATKELIKKVAPYNPRKMSSKKMKALQKSIRYFGMVEPIVFNTRTDRIVGGHQRVHAALAEGIEKVPVVHVDLDEPSEKQLNIALNNITGEWDNDLLAALLKDIIETSPDPTLTGFDAEELAKLTEGIDAAGMDAPVDELPQKWEVLVTCESEQRQVELLERLAGEGWTCRALL